MDEKTDESFRCGAAIQCVGDVRVVNDTTRHPDTRYRLHCSLTCVEFRCCRAVVLFIGGASTSSRQITFVERALPHPPSRRTRSAEGFAKTVSSFCAYTERFDATVAQLARLSQRSLNSQGPCFKGVENRERFPRLQNER